MAGFAARCWRAPTQPETLLRSLVIGETLSYCLTLSLNGPQLTETRQRNMALRWKRSRVDGLYR